MRVIRWCVGGCICLFLAACSFDDDAEFFPVTHQAFLGIQSESGTGLRFWGISNDQIQENRGNAWGIPEQAIGDFRIAGESLWISDLQDHQMVEIGLDSDQVQEVHDLGEANAHFFQIGETYVCFSDTLTQQIGFLHKKKGELFFRDPGEKPGIMAYRSGKFYIQLADSLLGIFQEQSLSEIARLNLDGPIQSIQVDPASASTFLYIGRRELRAFSINFNTDALLASSIPAETKKVLHSTIDSPRFGKEVSGRAILSNEGVFQLDTLNLSEIEDAVVDFFEAQVYFIRAGGLFRRNIRSGEESLLGSVEGNFKQSGFYIENIGN